MQTRLSFLLRLFISLASISLLGWLLWRTDREALFQSLSNISIPSTLLALALVQAQIVLSALRWRFTSARLGKDIPPAKAISEYYVASLLNQTLPGGVGGDVVRAWRMRGRESGGWKQPTKAIIFERASGQIALFILALTGLCIYFSVVAPNAAVLSLLVIGILIVLSLFIFTFRTFQTSTENRHSLWDDILEAFVRRRAWLVQFCLSAGVLAAYIGVFHVAAYATGTALPFVASVTIIPFCLIAMLIPTGFGGWGTREAAAMALWPLLGLAPSAGLSASITYGWLSLLGAIPGIAVILVSALKPKAGTAS